MKIKVYKENMDKIILDVSKETWKKMKKDTVHIMPDGKRKLKDGNLIEVVG